MILCILGVGCAVKLLFLPWLASYVLSSYPLGMAFLSSNSWMGVPGVSCCMYLSRLSEALIYNMKPSHQHFWITIVMLISLIKIGSISIKNKLGTMLSKPNIFAGLPLPISKVSASSAWCFWACGFVKNTQDAGSSDLESGLSLSVVRLVSV